MKDEIYLSVIIPVYNEEKIIKKTLLDVNDFFAVQKYSGEIIVVDDGSRDKTIAIIEELKTIVKNLVILKNDKNRGKGYSVKEGMLAAKGKFRLFMDADNSTSIDQVKNFLPFLKNEYDIVIGNRGLRKSQIKKRQSFYKEILGNIGNILIRILAVPNINDTQCGFKCFSAEFVENVFPKLKINRWGFDIEILVLANKFNYKIKTVPIIWENRKESGVFLKDYFFTLFELSKIKINLLRKIYDK